MSEALARGPNPSTARLVKPTGPNPATARVLGKVKSPNFLEAAGNVVGAMTRDVVAGIQGTSPDTSLNKPLGEVANMDWGDAYKDANGKYQPLDATRHVVFQDPNTGKAMAFERNEETNERWGALGRIVGTGAITGPVTKTAKALAAAPPVPPDDFALSGIEAGLAHRTDNRGVKTLYNALKETPIASGPIQKAEEKMLAQTAGSLENIASKYGPGQSMEDAGRALREGGEKFLKGTGNVADTDLLKVPTRKGGFDKKAGALYKRLDQFFKAGDTVDAKSTMDALTSPQTRFDNKALAASFVDPKLKPFAEAIKGATNGKLSFNDLKAFRTEVGRLLRKPSITSDINQEQLKYVYGAITQDLKAAAAAKGPEAVKAFERATTYYNAGLNRIKTTLDSVLKEVNSVEKVAGDIQRMAADGKATANIKKLRDLRKSVPEEEWKVVSSSVLRHLGKPTAGTAKAVDDIDFAPSTFLTNWSKLSTKAKNELFSTAGNHQLRRELDALVNVVGRQKEVGKLGNHSGTARQIITVASGAGLYADPVTTILTGLSATGASLALTTPKFVKALQAVSAYEKKFPGKALTTQYARLRHAALGVPLLHKELQVLAEVPQSTQQAAAEEE